MNDKQRTTPGLSMDDAEQVFNQTIETPMEQTLQFQKSAAQAFLGWLEASVWMQNQGVDMTRQFIDRYIDTVEETVGQTEEMADTRVETMRSGFDQFAGSQQYPPQQAPHQGRPQQQMGQSPTYPAQQAPYPQR